MIKKILISLIFVILIFSSFPNIVLSTTINKTSIDPMDSPWPMKCHDNRHTGLSPYSTADNNGVEIWRFKTSNWIEGGAVIDDDGIIYFGNFHDYLYAIYSNGTLKWRYKTDGWIWSTPAIADDGVIYIGTYSAKIYAIDTNGTLKWSLSSGGSIVSSPAIADDGTIYFGTYGGMEHGGYIIAINPNGTKKWSYETGYDIASSPAIADDGKIYIGSGDGYLYAMNPDGTLSWKFKTGSEIHSHPSISEDGIIYFGSNDKYLYALYPNGTLKWKFNINGGLYASASIGYDGIIYVSNHELYAIYPNGSLKWQFDFGDNRHVAHSSPAISSDGIIYLGLNIGQMSGGEIISIYDNGTEQWRKKITSRWIESSPCIGADGTVYIGTSDEDDMDNFVGYLYAFGKGNHPPNKPQITGPESGIVYTNIDYTFVTTDPELEDVYYYIEWGDSKFEEWIGPYNSGEEITLSHSWSTDRTYSIKAKAKDINGNESDWTVKIVSMPRITVNINSLFNLNKEKCSNLFQLLKFISNNK